MSFTQNDSTTQSSVTALDFEMFNTKHYWSICWAGLVVADHNLLPKKVVSRVVNPLIREKFIGPMSLPFTSRELTQYPTFDKIADEIFTPLSGSLVIGHALENDLRMIAEVCKKFSLVPPDFDYIDTNVCYNAVRGQATDHSLSSLCAEFNIEFSAHDPSEDARASMAVIHALKGERTLDAFLSEYGIVKGRFSGGLIRRSYFNDMAEKQRTRIGNYNAIFDTAMRLGQGGGSGYYLHNQLVQENDLSAVAEAILLAGGRLCVDSYVADFTVTNDLTLADTEYNILPFRTLVLNLGLDPWQYDYTPKKVTDSDGKGMSLTNYLSQIYETEAQSGPLSGKTFCFCKAAERRPDFFELFRRVVAFGGQVTPRLDEGVTFVVTKLTDLKSDSSDGRVIAFKRFSANRKVMTLKELTTLF